MASRNREHPLSLGARRLREHIIVVCSEHLTRTPRTQLCEPGTISPPPRSAGHPGRPLPPGFESTRAWLMSPPRGCRADRGARGEVVSGQYRSSDAALLAAHLLKLSHQQDDSLRLAHSAPRASRRPRVGHSTAAACPSVGGARAYREDARRSAERARTAVQRCREAMADSSAHHRTRWPCARRTGRAPARCVGTPMARPTKRATASWCRP